MTPWLLFNWALAIWCGCYIVADFVFRAAERAASLDDINKPNSG